MSTHVQALKALAASSGSSDLLCCRLAILGSLLNHFTLTLSIAYRLVIAAIYRAATNDLSTSLVAYSELASCCLFLSLSGLFKQQFKLVKMFMQ